MTSVTPTCESIGHSLSSVRCRAGKRCSAGSPAGCRSLPAAGALRRRGSGRRVLLLFGSGEDGGEVGMGACLGGRRARPRPIRVRIFRILQPRWRVRRSATRASGEDKRGAPPCVARFICRSLLLRAGFSVWCLRCFLTQRVLPRPDLALAFRAPLGRSHFPRPAGGVAGVGKPAGESGRPTAFRPGILFAPLPGTRLRPVRRRSTGFRRCRQAAAGPRCGRRRHRPLSLTA